MPRFNRPIPPRTPDARTEEGGPGFTRSPRDELFLLGLANMVGTDTFYEKGDARDQRFLGLVREVTKSDPGWTADFIKWLRSEGLMRTAPIVAAAEYVRAGGPNGRVVVRSVLQRPDEPAELIGYWHSHYGRNIPQPIKRGIADSLQRLYTERNTLRYDGESRAIRFGDVVELTHPVPKAPWQSALFKTLINRRHGREGDNALTPTLDADRTLQQMPESARRAHLAEAIEAGWSWERLSGWLPGGMDKEAWEAVVPNMGLMALTRNLRNFDKVGISAAMQYAVTGRFLDPEEVRRSRQFPLRFLTAWKAVSSIRWGMALEGALNASLSNVPALPGRTLVLVDVSPSMKDAALSGRTDGRADDAVKILRWEVAGVFGAAIAQRAENADIVLFDFNPIASAKLAPSESILRFVEQCGELAGRSNGTDILHALAESYHGHNRVVIITDEQQGYPQQRQSFPGVYYHPGATMLDQIENPARMAATRTPVPDRWGWEDVAHIHCPVYTFNLGGNAVGVTPNERNWHTFGGLSDACFKLLPILEGRHRGLWPWELEDSPVSEMTVEESG